MTRLRQLLPCVLLLATGCIVYSPAPEYVRQPPPDRDLPPPPPDRDRPPPPDTGATATTRNSGTQTSAGATTATTSTSTHQVRQPPPKGKNGPDCPATYGDGKWDCQAKMIYACNYPQGRCECAQPEWCFGPAPPKNRPFQWTCHPTCGAVGTPCHSKAVCGRGCCGVQVSCVNGTWQKKQMPCSP